MSRAPDVADRLWAALRRLEQADPVGGDVAVSDLVAKARAARPTVRRYLREWALAGYVEWPNGAGGSVVRCALDDARPPFIVRDGTTAYLSHPGDPDTFWAISRAGDGQSVTRRSRSEDAATLRTAPLLSPDDAPPRTLYEGECPCCGSEVRPDLRACVKDGPQYCRRCPSECGRECQGGERCVAMEGDHPRPGDRQASVDVPAPAAPINEMPAPESAVAVTTRPQPATPPPDVMQLLAPGGASVRTPEQAAARIHAIHDVMRALSVVAQLQLMESCWVIKSHCQLRVAFDAFLAEHGVDAVLAPDEAWAMALTHDVQRRHHVMRDLVSARPAQAMQWVRGFVDAHCEERLDELDERDREVVSLLHGPPRALRAKVRAWLAAEARHTGTGGPPAEPPPAPPEPPAAVHPGTRWREAVDRLRDADAALADVAGDVADLCATTGSAPAAQATRLLHLVDSLQASLDAIAGALVGGEP